MTEIEQKLIENIRSVVDPELFISVVDLGLIYEVKETEGKAEVKMTFTSIACPAGPQMMREVELACLAVPGIHTAEVEVVFNPPWDPRTMATEEGKSMLGIFE